MTLTVSVSEIRSNISHYLDKVRNGTRVLIRDEKRDIAIAQITQVSSFDKNTYEKVLHKVAGIFSAEQHSNWSTKAKISKWLTKSRLQNDRSF